MEVINTGYIIWDDKNVCFSQKRVVAEFERACECREQIPNVEPSDVPEDHELCPETRRFHMGAPRGTRYSDLYSAVRWACMPPLCSAQIWRDPEDSFYRVRYFWRKANRPGLREYLLSGS